jgi:hypothetical protein
VAGVAHVLRAMPRRVPAGWDHRVWRRPSDPWRRRAQHTGTAVR